MKRFEGNYILYLCYVFIILILPINCHSQYSNVNLRWLSGNPPPIKTAVSWGVPWPKGVIKTDQQFILTNSANDTLPLQSWPLAYWPDGSLKWVGYSTVAGQNDAHLTIIPGSEKMAYKGISVSETPTRFRIINGNFYCSVPKNGSTILDSVSVNSVLVGNKGRLECILLDNSGDNLNDLPLVKAFQGNTEKVTVEQNGPVRAVIRVQGRMKDEKGSRQWLPFDMRLYFHAGSESVKIINTIIYDGNEHKDYIKGLAFSLSVPFREEVQNRHIRFSGESPGVWAEPVKPLTNRAGRLTGRNLYPEQLAGQRIPDIRELQQPQQKQLLRDMPSWNDYRLTQHNANGFNIQKRTNSSSSWIDAAAGIRAGGAVFAGDVDGGLSACLKDFWQSYPAALEIKGATDNEAQLKLWIWSPYSEVMDMRHYDTVGHGLAATYEDVQEGLSTPYGVGRTSEIMLFACSSVPSNELFSNQAEIASYTPRLTITPEYLHSVNLFGYWSLPDRSSPGKIWIEDQLNKAIELYKKEIDQRNWYGFWNYGDVMHAYDNNRHTWNYDIGGYAWDNTELGSDLWLWYSYIRSGREDIFLMAEAMTRHTSEVDVYHMGDLKGLGSRHNVRHWGCGSKEVRESQSAPRRFYYYLTTDERTGDIMREVAENADYSMAKLDPLRLILPKTQYPTHARIGPDWLALVGNWMTEWERTGDKKWLNYINIGINSFSKMPYGFYSGEQGAFGYDPDTKKLYQLNDEIGHIHLSALMGGPEVAFELSDLMKSRNWDKLWIQFCELWGAPKEEVKKVFGKEATVGQSNNNWYSRLPAYLYMIKNDPEYADRAWKWFLNSTRQDQFVTMEISGNSAYKIIEEAPGISTNSTAQWCLNAIEVLEMAGDRLPEKHVLWEK